MLHQAAFGRNVSYLLGIKVRYITIYLSIHFCTKKKNVIGSYYIW